MNNAITLFGFPPTHFGLSLRRFLEAQPTASHPVPISTLRARLLGRAEAPAGASRLSPQERRTLPAQEVFVARLRQLVVYGALQGRQLTKADPVFWVRPGSAAVHMLLEPDPLKHPTVRCIVRMLWERDGVTRSLLSSASQVPGEVDAALEVLADARAIRIRDRGPVGSRLSVPDDFRLVASLTGYGEHLANQLGLTAAA